MEDRDARAVIEAAELEAGQAAYDQAAAFAALRRRRMGLVYASFPILFAVMGVAGWWLGQKTIGFICTATAIADAIFTAWKWRQLRADDARNRAQLAHLQKQYGDDLPWLEAERQMAEIRRIQAEAAGSGFPPDSPR